MSYGIVLFKTPAMAVKAERALNQEGYGVSLMPAPRQFASDSNIAIRITWSYREVIKAALEKAGVEIQGIQEVK